MVDRLAHRHQQVILWAVHSEHVVVIGAAGADKEDMLG